METILVIVFSAFVLLALQVWQTFETRQHRNQQGDMLKEIHALVNSGMGEQLRIGMVSARTLANLTNSPSDIEKATAAEKKYHQHEDRQKISDEDK